MHPENAMSKKDSPAVIQQEGLGTIKEETNENGDILQPKNVQ